MKKILLVANRTNSFWFFRKEIIQELIKKEYKVSLVANKDEYYKNFKNYNIKFYEIKQNINSFNIINIFLIFIKIRQICEEFKPDIVQSYTVVPNLICPFLKIFYKLKIFSMITGMGYIFSSGNKLLLFVSTLLYKISFNYSDHIIFTNKSNLNYFKKHNIIKNHAFTMIPASGVKLSKYKKIKKSSNKKEFNILFVGRLIKSKGVFDLISIFKKLKIKNKKLLIIGKEDRFSPEGVNINKLIKGNKNISHIKESNKLEKYYNNADIFLFPSYSEGMPTVVMEAFACGLPCFTYAVPGCDDIIINNRTGYKCKLYDVDTMVNGIENLYKNKKKLKIISRNCLLYSKKFDRKKIVSKIINLYEKSFKGN